MGREKESDDGVPIIDQSTVKSTGASLGKLNNDVDDEIRQIEEAVRTGLHRLTLKQRKFVEFWSTGDYSRKDAAMKAGYTEGSAHVMAYKLLVKHPIISQITPLLQRLDQLKHGVPTHYKRKRLLELIDLTSTPGENFNPSAANSSIRLLAELDGDIKTANGGPGNIILKINTGISREPVTPAIEGETVEIGDNDMP